MPSDDEWYRAIAQIRAGCPEDIFPPDSPSVDAQSGTFARSLCDQIIRLAEQFNAEQYEDVELCAVLGHDFYTDEPNHCGRCDDHIDGQVRG